MIDWDSYKYGEEICLKILHLDEIKEIRVKLLEYGWHEHGRIRITAILEIISSDSPEFSIGAHLELPIKTDGVIDFIMIEHLPGIPRHKTIHTGEIVAVCT